MHNFDPNTMQQVPSQLHQTAAAILAGLIPAFDCLPEDFEIESCHQGVIRTTQGDYDSNWATLLLEDGAALHVYVEPGYGASAGAPVGSDDDLRARMLLMNPLHMKLLHLIIACGGQVGQPDLDHVFINFTHTLVGVPFHIRIKPVG